MKIIQLIQQPQLRGAEIFACQLATLLNERGHENIIVPVFNRDCSLPFKGKIIFLNGNPSKRFSDFAPWKNLATLIAAEKPDIIQANAGDTLKYAVLSKLLFGWKQPIVFRNASTLSLYIKTLPAKLLNGFFYRFASHIVSVSETSKQDFLQLFPGKKNSITTIPIGVSEIALPPKKTNCNPAIIHVGGFTYEKNHKGLLRIFKLFSEKHPNAVLQLVGDGPLKPLIEQQIQELGLRDNVKMLGFRNDAIELIHQADLLVLPSLIEGLPGVILEAMYAKTPVVAYDVGGIKEIVQDGYTGRLIKPGDEHGFVVALQDVFGNEEKTQTMIHNAFEKVTLQYTNYAIVQKFEAVYQSLIK